MPFYDVVFNQKYWDDILCQRTIGASVSIYIYIYNYIFLFLFVFDKPSNLALNLQIIKPLDRCELDNEEKRRGAASTHNHLQRHLQPTKLGLVTTAACEKDVA